MNKLYIFLLLCIVSSCKKEPVKIVVPVKKVTPIYVPKTSVDEKSVKVDTTLLTPFDSKLLKEFYASTDYQTVWVSKKSRKTILSQLKKSDEEGLNPDDYNVNVLSNFENKITKLDDQKLAKYDVLLTYSFQKYISHLSNGRLNPKKLYTDWELIENQIDINETVINLLKNDSLNDKIELLKPNHLVYKELKKALKIIAGFPRDDFEKIEILDKIIPNDTLSQLVAIKKRLIYWNDLKAKDSLNSIYDEETARAVKKFQTRHGLAADGVIGKGTVAAMNFTKKQRKAQIIANLERWKWFNHNLAANYIIVNIPNYSLNVVENNDTTVVRKVVVGTIKRKTPVLTSTLKTVVFNPTWTVPPTILKEDIVPAMKRNRNYLKNKDITIYDSANKIVEPNQWNPNKPNNYRYVQSPGIGNSLGLMKILFPNNHSVYLHDTNHRNLFGMHNRSLSSGCVRVENPLELAQHLLNDPKNWSKEKIDSIITTKKTSNIKIAKQYAIYLWYWTAWSENNKLIFRDDIYDLDRDLYAKLRN